MSFFGLLDKKTAIIYQQTVKNSKTGKELCAIIFLKTKKEVVDGKCISKVKNCFWWQNRHIVNLWGMYLLLSAEKM